MVSLSNSINGIGNFDKHDYATLTVPRRETIVSLPIFPLVVHDGNLMQDWEFFLTPKLPSCYWWGKFGTQKQSFPLGWGNGGGLRNPRQSWNHTVNKQNYNQKVLAVFLSSRLHISFSKIGPIEESKLSKFGECTLKPRFYVIWTAWLDLHLWGFFWELNAQLLIMSVLGVSLLDKFWISGPLILIWCFVKYFSPYLYQYFYLAIPLKFERGVHTHPGPPMATPLVTCLTWGEGVWRWGRTTRRAFGKRGEDALRFVCSKGQILSLVLGMFSETNHYFKGKSR